MKFKNKRQLLLALAISFGVITSASASERALVEGGSASYSPVITPMSGAISVSSAAPLSIIDTRSHVWQTTDGKRVPLSDTVKIFDLKKAMEARTTDPTLYAKVIDIYNSQYAQLIRSLAQKDTLDIPELAEYNKNTIKNVNFYQFQAQDKAAHHVAYAFELQLEPESIIYNEEGYQLSRKLFLQMIAAAEKDNNKAVVEKLKADLKQHDDFYQNKRVGYHPDELYRWAEIQNRENMAQGKQIEGFDTYIMQMMQQFSQSFVNQQQTNSIDMKAIKPEQKDFMAKVQALQEATLKTMNIENLEAEVIPEIKEHTALGKLIFNHQRSNLSYDGYQVPMATFSLIRYEATGPIITFIMSNDADGEFWQQQFERILQLK